MELKFSDKTIAMFKNLSEIRNSVHFVAGSDFCARNLLNSLSVNMTIDEVLPYPVVIRELNEFIGSITGAVMGGCKVKFNDSASCLITNGSYKINYAFGNLRIEPAYTTTFRKVEDPDLVLTLNKEQFSNLLTMGRFYGHTHIQVAVKDTELTVSSVKVTSTLAGTAVPTVAGNAFTIVVGEEKSKDVMYYIDVELFNKIIDGGVTLEFYTANPQSNKGGTTPIAMLQASATAYNMKYAMTVRRV